MARNAARSVFVTVLVAGFAVTATLVALASSTADDNRRDRFEQRAIVLRDGIRSEIDAASEVLFALRSAYTIQPRLSRGDFHAYAENLDAGARSPGLRALEHASVVPAADIDRFVESVRADETLAVPQRAVFALRQVAASDDHVVIDAVHPFEGNEAAFGLDLRGSTSRSMAVDRARDSTRMVASEPIDLVQEPGSSAVLLLMPLYRDPQALREEAQVGERRAAFSGLVLAVFHIGDLLADQLGAASDIEVEIVDRGTTGAPRADLDRAAVLYDPDDDRLVAQGSLGQPSLVFELEVGGRRWTLLAAASPEFGETAPLLPVAVGAGGVVASLLGAALLSTVSGARANRRRQMFESFLEFAPDAVVVVDRSGRIAQVNRQAEALFGYSRAELLGGDVERLVPADLRDAHRGHVGAFAAAPSTRRMGENRQLVGTRKDGTTVAVDVSLSPIEAEGGTLFAAAIRDVTDRRRAQRALEEAAEQLRTANKLKDQFLDVTAHELRTPLTAIEGFAEVLSLDAAVLDEAGRGELVDRIASNAGEMRGMVNRLMELSRLDADRVRLEVDDVDLAQVIRSVLNRYRPAAEGRVLSSTVPEGLQVRGDRLALGQIISNLVSNAIKFSASGTAVTVAAHETGEYVEVQVVDEGPGIAQDEQATLFEHFVQGSVLAPDGRRGAGVGLNIVRRYVELLGGTVGVRSRVGQGATFWFRVPASEPARERSGQE